MTILQRIEDRGCGCDAAEHAGGPIGIDAALARIATRAAPVGGIEQVPLMKARGRVLAEPVSAASMTPPFDNAAMDGYAVASVAFTGAGPWTFPVTARIPAGEAALAPITGSSAARIFTGAPLPVGADTVIAQENAERHGDRVTFDTAPGRGTNIRMAGEDMRPGQAVVAAGTRLRPHDIAACAAAGAETVEVRRRLRIGVLVTGDELRMSGAPLREAGIRDVNSPMLCAMLEAPHVDVVHVEQIADTRDAVDRGVSRMIGDVDLIVTTGGVSVGEEDHLKPVLTSMGADIHFSGVAIKPGKPVSLGSIDTCHWLGLPGNPLAAFVTWHLFGTALVRSLTGESLPRATRRNVVIGNPIRRKPGRCEIRPAFRIGFDGFGREVVGFDDATHSGRVGKLPRADGLMFLPAEVDHLPEGALVEFQAFCEN